MRDSDFLPKIEENDIRIMSFEEYAEKHQGGVYEYSYGDIEVYGSLHTHDAEDDIFDELEQKIGESDADIVLVEGGEDINDLTAEERIAFVERFKSEPGWRNSLKMDLGESGYSAALAAMLDKEVLSPEPDFASEIKELEKSHSREHILTYYIFRQISQYARTEGEKPELEEYLSGLFRKIESVTEWDDFDYSLDTVKRVQYDLYGAEDIDPMDELYNAAIDPVPWKEDIESQTAINRVSGASSDFRDQNILKEIQRLKDEGKRIFVVYGASHAQRLEPALKAMYS